jgi:hypothetical protein
VQKAYLGGAASDSSLVRARPASQEEPLPAAPAVFAPTRPAPGVDELINGSLDELIRTAENIQAEHVRAERRAHNGSGAKAVPAPRRTARRAADTSLQDAIARIEAAARAAAKGSRTE